MTSSLRTGKWALPQGFCIVLLSALVSGIINGANAEEVQDRIVQPAKKGESVVKPPEHVTLTGVLDVKHNKQAKREGRLLVPVRRGTNALSHTNILYRVSPTMEGDRLMKKMKGRTVIVKGQLRMRGNDRWIAVSHFTPVPTGKEKDPSIVAAPGAAPQHDKEEERKNNRLPDPCPEKAHPTP